MTYLVRSKHHPSDPLGGRPQFTPRERALPLENLIRTNMRTPIIGCSAPVTCMYDFRAAIPATSVLPARELSSLVRETVRAARSELPGTRINLSLPEIPVPWEGDPNDFSFILREALMHLSQYLHPARKINLALSASRDFAKARASLTLSREFDFPRELVKNSPFGSPRNFRDHFERQSRRSQELAEKNHFILSHTFSNNTYAFTLKLDFDQRALTEEILPFDRLAARLSFIPEQFSFSGVRLGGFSKPYSPTIGGDFMGAIPVDEKRLLVYLCDVSGHGVAPAVWAYDAKRAIERLARENPLVARSPKRLAIELNAYLEPLISTQYYLTGFFCLIDTGRRALNYYFAAHEPPWLLTREGMDKLEEDGMHGLGMFRRSMKTSPPEQVCAYPPGSRLVINSDGLWDAQEKHSEGLERVLRGNRARYLSIHPQAAAEHIEGELVKNMVRERLDDATVLVVELP